MDTTRKKHVCASELELNHAAKHLNCLRFEAWNRLLPASVEDRHFTLNAVNDGFKLSNESFMNYYYLFKTTNEQV
jgi:hypothetical protein